MAWFSDNPAFVVENDVPFPQVATAMDSRFWGLPSFHRSVRLLIVEIRCLRDRIASTIEPPSQLMARTPTRLRPRLAELIGELNRVGGRKSLQLLRFKVGLCPEFALKHFGEYSRRRGLFVGRLIEHFAATIRVPIAMVVGSSYREDVYQSHAVGIRGVTNYRSAIVLRPEGHGRNLLVEGGLEAAVETRHIDHISRHLANAIGLPDDLLNEYIRQHLYPERQEIMQRLCDYVLSGLEQE